MYNGIVMRIELVNRSVQNIVKNIVIIVYKFILFVLDFIKSKKIFK